MTHAPSDQELKPCPFCGAKAELDENHGYYNAKGELRRQAAIFCAGCSANMCFPRDDFRGEKNESILHGVTSEWNSRLTPPSPSATIGDNMTDATRRKVGGGFPPNPTFSSRTVTSQDISNAPGDALGLRHRNTLADTLEVYANDPMWADHAEVRKDVLLAVVSELRTPSATDAMRAAVIEEPTKGGDNGLQARKRRLIAIEAAVGGAYEFADSRSFWIDTPIAQEIARRVDTALSPHTSGDADA